ncbi:MAG: N-acetylmuramoyl-L-alanine amidase [Spirochaetes bacterium]|nr:N-acetylmuramoyl-L-alanine amidase [Spirochaetota bacterium]
MKNKKTFNLIISIIIIISGTKIILPAEGSEQNGTDTRFSTQSPYIEKLIASEKNGIRKNELRDIVNYIDLTYSGLYSKLKNGGKITIFFDPAHGMLKNGSWQGNVTWRQSTEGLPEEFYSLALSRKLYSLLKDNKYINVVSTDDYINALEGNSDIYNNIAFSNTLELAKLSNSFMIISSHLNNIAPVWKADGVTNLPGIQITCDKFGNQLLTEVKTTYKGYLTLYNKLDPSGFSYDVAVNFKANMMKNNLSPNNWDYGAVAYDRFSFFYDFPISIIFESGFISNPKEEAMLRSESVQDTIADSQYRAILEAVQSKFRIDISGNDLKKNSGYDKLSLDALKISRLTLHYISKNELQNAINLCVKLEQEYKNSSDFKIAPYIEIKNDLLQIRNSLAAARKYRKKKSFKTSRKYYLQAVNISKKSPVYHSLKYHAAREYNEITSKKIKVRSSDEGSGSGYKGHPPTFQPMSIITEKHNFNTPYIFVFDSNDTLQTAIERSITSDPVKVKKLTDNFRKASITKIKWKKYYSSKDKKYKWKKITIVNKVSFSKGIYIIKLDKNMKIISFEKVSRVSFNPRKYQNQLFFKNSYLAEKTKNRLI